MKKSFEELINVAIEVRNFLGVTRFCLYAYESCTYVDFYVIRVTDLQGLLERAQGLELKFFAEDNTMIVRLFEREEEDEE